MLGGTANIIKLGNLPPHFLKVASYVEDLTCKTKALKAPLYSVFLVGTFGLTSKSLYAEFEFCGEASPTGENVTHLASLVFLTT